jgi:methionyl-tRNA formyltransferase
MDLVFAGSSDFAVKSLDALVRAGHRVLAILTQPDRPAGRKRRLSATPVKQYALSAGLCVMDPVSLRNPDVVGQLRKLAPEVMVVVDYGLIIPSAVLDVPVHGCINGHASLLPRWRGAAPIERTVLAGDAETGVTIMQMDEGLDTGPILLFRPIRVDPLESAGELRSRLAEICAEALVDALRALEGGRLAARPQDESGVCYASKITPREARVDWSRPADEIARQIRAFNPRPGAYTGYQGKRLKILEAAVSSERSDEPPGTVFRVNAAGIDVATGDGSVSLQTLQLPGGKPMSAAAFLNGHSVLHERLGGEA